MDRLAPLSLMESDCEICTSARRGSEGDRSDPKTDHLEPQIALDESLAEGLWQHWRSSSFRAPDELVLCHPLKGSPFVNGYFGRS